MIDTFDDGPRRVRGVWRVHPPAVPTAATTSAQVMELVRYEVEKVLSLLMRTLLRFPEAAAAIREVMAETFGSEPAPVT
jgi:hypothetical protein